MTDPAQRPGPPPDQTQRVTPLDETRAMPPPSAARPPSPPPPGPPQQRQPRRRRDRSGSGLYLPVWSVALMLVVVFVVAFGLFGIVLSLGGDGGPGAGPRVVIITAVPSNTPGPGALLPGVAAATFPPAQVTLGALPTFALEGPTLPPVILSPTPIAITIGSTVIVNAESLNVRSGAGTDQELLFTVPEGTTFTIVEGPISATGFTWWRVQNTADPSQSGWAAALFLDVVPTAPTPTSAPA